MSYIRPYARESTSAKREEPNTSDDVGGDCAFSRVALDLTRCRRAALVGASGGQTFVPRADFLSAQLGAPNGCNEGDADTTHGSSRAMHPPTTARFVSTRRSRSQSALRPDRISAARDGGVSGVAPQSRAALVSSETRAQPERTTQANLHASCGHHEAQLVSVGRVAGDGEHISIAGNCLAPVRGGADGGGAGRPGVADLRRRKPVLRERHAHVPVLQHGAQRVPRAAVVGDGDLAADGAVGLADIGPGVALHGGGAARGAGGRHAAAAAVAADGARPGADGVPAAGRHRRPVRHVLRRVLVRQRRLHLADVLSGLRGLVSAQ
ncbi:translation initiation factor IF-2 [Gracilaria domingensis]|nr:translation initiation factor IF-2 [Gracilaria domingensis]